MRDPYEVLGVQKNATPAAVKSAFRRLAKKLHPDANKTDKTAATKFAELNAAYEIVGDEDKRKAFDRGEIDAEGKPRFQGFRRRRRPAAGRWGAGGRRPGQDSHFESFTWGSDGFQRGGGRPAARAAAAASTTFSRRCSAARPAAGRRTQFEPEEFGGAAARPRRHRHRHHHAAGGSDRHLAPRASADRQGDRRQDSRRASPTARPSG